MPEGKKTSHAPRFGLVRIYWNSIIASSAGVGHMVGAPSNGASRRTVDHIEDKRRMHRNRGMQAVRGLPRPVSDATYELSLRTGWMEWKPPSVACKREALADKTLHPHLHAFDR
jgi:hypothetical protein